jgi:hypothetical protein
MPVEELVQTLCDEKHHYTQWGSRRPYGINIFSRNL